MGCFIVQTVRTENISVKLRQHIIEKNGVFFMLAYILTTRYLQTHWHCSESPVACEGCPGVFASHSLGGSVGTFTE